MSEAEKQSGVYRKFDVKRADGSSGPGGKHANCAFFVLDLEHDAFSRAALRAYAKACRKRFPALARDLGRIVRTPRHKRCGCRSAGECTHNKWTPDGPNGAMLDALARKPS